jgi:hypothetical protein
VEVISYARINGLPIVDPAELSKDAARLGVSDKDWRGLATSVNVPRGENPTIAYVLLSAQVLDKLLEKPHDFISLELVVRAADATDTTFPGANTLTFGDLLIHSTKAVMSTYGKDDCPYLVELRDWRELARMGTLGAFGHGNINVMIPDNTWFYESSLDYVESAFQPFSWKSSLESVLGQGIHPVVLPQMTYAIAPIKPEASGIDDDIPVNYQFAGWGPWSAYNRLLHDCGHLYVPTYNGSVDFGFGHVIPEVFDGIPVENEALAKARTVSTDKSHPREIVATRLPRDIWVLYPLRGWTYQNPDDSKLVNATDQTLSWPVGYSLQQGSSAGRHGTSVAIKVSTPMRSDSQGTVLNQDQIDDVAKRTAEAYMASIQDNDQDETFSGLHPLNPTNNIQSVSFFDFGAGFQTKIRNRWIGMDRVQNFQPAHALPDLVVPNIPYHRCVYGKSRGLISGGQDIPPNQLGVADVYWYKAEGGSQGWKKCTPNKQIIFRNAGLGDIAATVDEGQPGEDATWVYCEFWWQSKEFVAFCGFQEP